MWFIVWKLLKWLLVWELGSMCGVLDIDFMLSVIMMLVDLVLIRLWFSMMVFIFELYILFRVVVLVDSGSLVVMVVWWVGVWLRLVGSM